MCIYVYIFIYTLCTYVKKEEINNRQGNSIEYIPLQFTQMNGLITQIGTFPVKTLHYLSSHSRVQLLKHGLQTTCFPEPKLAVIYRTLQLVGMEKPEPSCCILALKSMSSIQSSVTAGIVQVAFVALNYICRAQRNYSFRLHSCFISDRTHAFL